MLTRLLLISTLFGFANCFLFKSFKYRALSLNSISGTDFIRSENGNEKSQNNDPGLEEYLKGPGILNKIIYLF